MVFAIKNGNPVGIGEVSRGLKCECVCVECGQRLVAKKGNKKEHHFAHSTPQTESQLRRCNEAYNHWLLKNIFADLDYMILPAWETEPQFTISLNPQLARVEKTYQGFRADCVVSRHDGLELIVEVINFNALNDDKKELIKREGSDCISVNAFGWIDTPVHWSKIISIRDQLKNDPSIKTWVYHSIGEANKKKQPEVTPTPTTNPTTADLPLEYRKENQYNRNGNLGFTTTNRDNKLVEQWRKDMPQKNSNAGTRMKNDAELNFPIRNDCKSNQCPLSLKSCWDCGYFMGFAEIINENEFFCGYSAIRK